MDVLLNFKQKVLGKKVQDIFMNPKYNNKIVAVPQFKTEIQLKISETTNALVHF